jgi:hypothetical protein
MLKNNKKCDGGFMLFGFVVSKCIGDWSKKSFYTRLVFYYMKPEKELLLF